MWDEARNAYRMYCGPSESLRVLREQHVHICVEKVYFFISFFISFQCILVNTLDPH